MVNKRRNGSTFSLLLGCLSAATLSHYARVDAAPMAAPHIRSGMHTIIITRASPHSVLVSLGNCNHTGQTTHANSLLGGGKSAACNDTNCPDLNAVIGPLGALERKWLQLRLLHFLATQTRAGHSKEGGKLSALPVPRSLKRAP